MRLEETIDKATYEKKYSELESILEGLSSEREQLEQSLRKKLTWKNGLHIFVRH
jgi:exonuclease VII small subunit